jgi:hypothetical protein
MYIALAGAAGLAAGAAAHTAYARMLTSSALEDFNAGYAPLRKAPPKEDEQALARRNAERIDMLEHYIYRLHKELYYSLPGENPFEDRKNSFEERTKQLTAAKAAAAAGTQ